MGVRAKLAPSIPRILPLTLLPLHPLADVHLQLLCGADLLESFATPNLWADQDVSYQQQ